MSNKILELFTKNNVVTLSKIEKLFIAVLTYDMSTYNELFKDKDCYKYSSLVDMDMLNLHLKILHSHFIEKDGNRILMLIILSSLGNIINALETINYRKLNFTNIVPNTWKLLLILLTNSSTTIFIKRVFSKPRLLKNHLRSTMLDDYFKELGVLYECKDLLDELDILKVCNYFVSRDKTRKIIFRKFDVVDTKFQSVCKMRRII